VPCVVACSAGGWKQGGGLDPGGSGGRSDRLDHDRVRSIYVYISVCIYPTDVYKKYTHLLNI